LCVPSKKWRAKSGWAVSRCDYWGNRSDSRPQLAALDSGTGPASSWSESTGRMFTGEPLWRVFVRRPAQGGLCDQLIPLAPRRRSATDERVTSREVPFALRRKTTSAEKRSQICQPTLSANCKSCSPRHLSGKNCLGRIARSLEQRGVSVRARSTSSAHGAEAEVAPGPPLVWCVPTQPTEYANRSSHARMSAQVCGRIGFFLEN